MKSFFTRFRILPLLVLVAILAFAVRAAETLSAARNVTASVLAAQEPAAGDAEKSTPESAGSDSGAGLGPAPGAGQDNAVPKSSTEPLKTDKVSPDASLPEIWADPATQDMTDSPEQMKLLEDLAARRQQLDAREKALATREALMKASEKQLDAKIGELGALKTQIEQLLGQQEKEQNGKIDSLVKIYENMKPKDAATIFNQMDMDVLLQVVSKMSERKSAPVMAIMDTAKANELTVRLTEMKKLPESPGEFMGAKMGARMDNAAPAGPVATPAPAGSAPLPGLDALGAPKTN
ncbi:MAG: hypothetical protein H6865_05840 [Rhodospirillales bacterium]|nr:hypothetical protein [Rhodospirillales bacterium]USO08101.1 MAG: hypothetical protein H6866_02455 [Rhodospirillales bacterium]